MTDNPIDMAIELLEYVESHGVVLDIDECEYVKDTLKTYRDEYISIKKSDMPEGLYKSLNNEWGGASNTAVYKAAALVAQTLEAEDD